MSARGTDRDLSTRRLRRRAASERREIEAYAATRAALARAATAATAHPAGGFSTDYVIVTGGRSAA